jgi:hypothetical protein
MTSIVPVYPWWQVLGFLLLCYYLLKELGKNDPKKIDVKGDDQLPFDTVRYKDGSWSGVGEYCRINGVLGWDVYVLFKSDEMAKEFFPLHVLRDNSREFILGGIKEHIEELPDIFRHSALQRRSLVRCRRIL